MKPEFAIGIDIGGSHICACLIDLKNMSVVQDTKHDTLINSKASSSEILDHWAHTINSTINKQAELSENKQPIPLGFSLPGPFDYKTGTAFYKDTDKYESLYGYHLPTDLGKRLNKPHTMRFVNDAAGFAIGNSFLPKFSNLKILAVTLGTGFGASFIRHNTPQFEGASIPKAGSLWHLPYRNGIADDYISTRWFLNQAKQLNGIAVHDVQEMANLARMDDRVLKIFEEFGKNLANILKAPLKEFEADALILGGRISLAYDLFSETLCSSLNTKKIDILMEISPDTETRSMIGAAALFKNGLWTDIKDKLPSF